jgi:hypothetical protein
MGSVNYEVQDTALLVLVVARLGHRQDVSRGLRPLSLPSRHWAMDVALCRARARP